MIKKFTFNNIKFEIRTGKIDGVHYIKTYHNNSQIGATYSVGCEIENDSLSNNGKSMIEELVKIAQSDIEKGLYIS